MREAPHVFISYARDDYPDIVEALKQQLAFLEEQGRITVFIDEQLETGAPAESEISEHIARSTAAMVLLSKKYLSRPFVVRTEIPLLEQRASRSPRFRVLPLLLDPCSWEDIPIFAVPTHRPNEGRTFSELPPAEQERQVFGAVRHLESFLEEGGGSAVRAARATQTNIIGRERERAVCADRLIDYPVLVLHGPPGQGKTELGRYLAASLINDFSDGWTEIDVQNETQFGNVMSLLGERLALPAGTAANETIARRKHLLLFDAFERLISASTAEQVGAFFKPLIAALRESGSRAIVTSQIDIPLSGGVYAHRVSPLEEDYAIRLFHEASRHQYLEADAAAVRSFLVEELGAHPYSIIIMGKYSNSLDLPFAALQKLWSETWSRVALYQPFFDQRALATAFELTFATLQPDAQTLFLALGSLPDGLAREDIDIIWPFAEEHLDSSLRTLAQRGLLDSRASDQRHVFRLMGPMFRFALHKLSQTTTDSRESKWVEPYFTALDAFYDRFVAKHAPQASDTQPAQKNQLIRRHFHNIHSSLERRLRTTVGEEAVSAARSVLSMYWAYHNNMSGTRDAVSSSNDAIRYLGMAKEVFRAHSRAEEVVRCVHYTGLILWLRGQTVPAKKMLESALKSADCTPDIQLDCQRAFAHMAYKEGRLGKAAKAYHAVAATARAIDDTETEIRTEMGLIDCYRKIGDYDAAVNCFSRIETRLPRASLSVRGNAVRARAYVALVKGDLQEAMEMYHEALSYFAPVSPFGEAHCRRGLGDVYTARGDYAAAAAEYDKSIELYDLARQNPSLGVCLVMLGRGRLAMARGDYDASLREFQGAAELLDVSRLNEPFEYAVAHELQGDLYHRMGRPEHALGQYEIALIYFRKTQARDPAKRTSLKVRKMRRIVE